MNCCRRAIAVVVACLAIAACTAAWPMVHAAAGTSPLARRVHAATVHSAQSAQKVERAGKDGVTLPKRLREVKPQYTAEAQRRHIQGSVVVKCLVLEDGSVDSCRLVRSLDPVYGLDEEALRAASQWRFQPATKDNVPVRVEVTIDLTFTLQGAPSPEPAPLSWPEAFPATPGATTAASDWMDGALEKQGFRVRFAYPAGWTLRTSGPAANWFDFVSSDYTRLVAVSSPLPSPAPPAYRLTRADLRRRAASMAEGFRRSGSKAIVRGTGQIKVAGLLWEWTDYSASASDPAVPARFRSRAFGMQGRVRVWHFMTTADGQAVGVFFRAAHADGTDEANEQEERRAAANFPAILARMSFTRR
jgi:protein TonB